MSSAGGIAREVGVVAAGGVGFAIGGPVGGALLGGAAGAFAAWWNDAPKEEIAMAFAGGAVGGLFGGVGGAGGKLLLKGGLKGGWKALTGVGAKEAAKEGGEALGKGAVTAGAEAAGKAAVVPPLAGGAEKVILNEIKEKLGKKLTKQLSKDDLELLAKAHKQRIQDTPSALLSPEKLSKLAREDAKTLIAGRKAAKTVADTAATAAAGAAQQAATPVLARLWELNKALKTEGGWPGKLGSAFGAYVGYKSMAPDPKAPDPSLTRGGDLPVKPVGMDQFGQAKPPVREPLWIANQADPSYPHPTHSFLPQVAEFYESPDGLQKTVVYLWESFGHPDKAEDVPEEIKLPKIATLSS